MDQEFILRVEHVQSLLDTAMQHSVADHSGPTPENAIWKSGVPSIGNLPISAITSIQVHDQKMTVGSWIDLTWRDFIYALRGAQQKATLRAYPIVKLSVRKTLHELLIRSRNSAFSMWCSCMFCQKRLKKYIHEWSAPSIVLFFRIDEISNLFFDAKYEFVFLTQVSTSSSHRFLEVFRSGSFLTIMKKRTTSSSSMMLLSACVSLRNRRLPCHFGSNAAGRNGSSSGIHLEFQQWFLEMQINTTRWQKWIH